MFFRLLMESFRRQRRRKMLAGVAILLGTTAVTAMLALATTIGDRSHKELAVYGANIVVYPKADLLDVKVGGVDVKPASGGAYLKESDLQKLKGIFWANNITGISPELIVHTAISLNQRSSINSNRGVEVDAIGLWFQHNFTNTLITGALALHPWWKLEGSWPSGTDQVVVGSTLATKFHVHPGDSATIPNYQAPDDPRKFAAPIYTITGVFSTRDSTDNR